MVRLSSSISVLFRRLRAALPEGLASVSVSVLVLSCPVAVGLVSVLITEEGPEGLASVLIIEGGYIHVLPILPSFCLPCWHCSDCIQAGVHNDASIVPADIKFQIIEN